MNAVVRLSILDDLNKSLSEIEGERKGDDKNLTRTIQCECVVLIKPYQVCKISAVKEWNSEIEMFKNCNI